MSVDLEACLLEEATTVVGRDVTRDDVLHKQFNINKLLAFVQRVHRRTGRELDVNSFYIWPTIGALCDALNAGESIAVPKMLLLKEGSPERPLILFAGGVSCFLEIKGILEGLDHDGAVFGMCLSEFNRRHTNPATVADEVTACLDELERQNLNAPLSLVGYSFGGLVALELARKVSERGQNIRFLALVDTQQSEHTWPWHVWVGHVYQRLARKFIHAAAAIARTAQQVNKTEASQVKDATKRTWLHRLRPLLFRFCSPKLAVYPELAPEWISGTPPDYESIGRQLLRMQGLYRPEPYEGQLVYYKAQGGSPTHCDPWKIWGRFLPNADWVEARGNHLSAIVGRNGAALGRDISRRIAEPARCARSVRRTWEVEPVARAVST